VSVKHMQENGRQSTVVDDYGWSLLLTNLTRSATRVL